MFYKDSNENKRSGKDAFLFWLLLFVLVDVAGALWTLRALKKADSGRL